MPNCKSCDEPIIWGKTIHGKNIPLDAKPEKRLIQEPEFGYYKIVDTYISHFQTCPNADTHRKR